MERKPFPTDQDLFGDDDRISFSKVGQSYILEDENGTEWEWLSAVNKWTQTISAEEMQQQAEAYKVAGVDESAPALNPAQKRKQAQLEDAETNPKAAKSGPGAGTGATAGAEPSAENGAEAGAVNNGSHANTTATATASASVPAPRKNTAIWVTGLPWDANRGELSQFFSKFGMIKESVEDDSKRIIMYADDEGSFKGEALIIYQGAESVTLALLYDGEPLRLEEKGTKMSIQPADTGYKSGSQGKTFKEGGNNTKQKPSKAQLKQKAEEVRRRLGEWSDDEEPPTTKQPEPAQFKTVLLRNIFTLHQLDEDAELKGEIQDEMQDEGKKFGEVKNVTVFDKEPAGLVTIRFSTAEAAQRFAAAYNDKKFDGRLVRTELIDGRNTKYRKSAKTEEQKAEEEKKRIEEYSKYIEGEGENH